MSTLAQSPSQKVLQTIESQQNSIPESSSGIVQKPVIAKPQRRQSKNVNNTLSIKEENSSLQLNQDSIIEEDNEQEGEQDKGGAKGNKARSKTIEPVKQVAPKKKAIDPNVKPDVVT